MSKSRLSRKQIRRADDRAKQLKSYAVATQVRMLAQGLPNQQALTTCLLQEQDVVRRRKMFEFMRPFLKFPNPECPSTIEAPRIIHP